MGFSTKVIARTDAVIAGLLVLAAIVVGSNHARELRMDPARPAMTGFVQRLSGAALMSACGRGLTTPAPAILLDTDTDPGSRVVRDFLAMRREAISCADIPPNLPVEGLDGLQRASRYLLMSMAGAWTLGGPAWSSIDRLLGVMFAVSVVFGYAAARAAMPRWIAAGVAVLYMLSPLHLQNLSDVRDYSKVPFLLISVSAMALLVTRTWSRGVVIGAAGLTGALLGIGFGMRSDVLVNVLLVIAVLPLGLPGRLSATWLTRTAAALACAAAFAVVVSPLSGSLETRSSPWHVALLGFSHESDAALDVAPAAYELGYFYSDSYVATIVDAYWGRRTGSDAKVSVGLPDYGEASRRYYFDTLASFPADGVTRGWASVFKVLELPFSQGAAASVALLRGVGVPLFLAVLLGVALRSVRLAAILFGLAIALGAYPAIQFHERHVFHLEFLSLWLLGVAVAWLVGVVRRVAGAGAGETAPARSVKRLVIAASLIAAAIVIPILLSRAIQQRIATGLFTSYIEAPVTAIDGRQPVANGLVRLAGGPAWPRSRGSRSMYADMLVVELAGSCRVPRITLTFQYGSMNPAITFTRTYAVTMSGPGHPTRVLVPVFESGAATPEADRLLFDGIDVPETQAACVTSVSRFSDPDRFPLLIPVVLPDDWRTRPWHQRLRRWEGDGSGVVAAAMGPDRSVDYNARMDARD